MNAERNTVEFTRQTVLNFRFLDAQSMRGLRADLGLSLSDAALFRCREYFRLQEGRDPTVRELLFLNAYARTQRRFPDAAAVMTIAGTDEDVRVFADMQKKQTTLRKENVLCGNTLCEWAELSGRYLSRSGLPPYHADFAGGHINEIAARTANACTACRTPQTAAALLPSVTKNPYVRNIVLLFPSGNMPFADEIAHFMQSHGHRGVELLAAPCGEGMLHHLLSLGCGLMLDTFSLPCHAPEIDPSAVLNVGNGALLLLVADEMMPLLLSCGLPLVPVGVTQPGDRILLRHGNEITLSLSSSILAFLRQVAAVDLSLPARAPVASAPAVQAQDGRLSGHVTARSGCEAALLNLIGTLRAQGGDPRRTTLTAVWETPPHQKGYEALAEAMLSVLDHHRVCAELAIPSHHHKHLMQHDLTAPRVTFFALAEQGAPASEDFTTHWQAACAARDFTTLRKLLYLTN